MKSSPKRKRARGTVLVPRSEKQRTYFEALMSPDVKAVIGIGFPGTGKSMFAAYAAAHAYNNGDISRIVLLRPNVGTGPEIGFLPGSEIEKTIVFHKQMIKYLCWYIGVQEDELLGNYEGGIPIVEIQSFWTLQGQDLTDALVLVDEAQNMTIDEMFILATRGAWKFICIGDTFSSQVLNPNVDNDTNGLAVFYECMGDLDYVFTVNFDSHDDILRPGIVKDAIIRLMPKIQEIKAKKSQTQRVEIVHLNKREEY